MTPYSYFDDFEAKLHAAARAHVAVGRHASGRRRRVASALPVVASVVVALVIGIVAVAAFTHRPGTGRPGTPAGVRLSRGQLIDTLSVLRRRQTRADLRASLPGPPFAPLPRQLNATERARALRERAQLLARYGDPVLDRSLIRVLRAADGDRISFFPSSFRPSPETGRRTEGLIVQLKTPHNGEIVNTLPTIASVEDFRAHGLAMFLDDDRGVVIVPDGVRSVTVDSIGRVLTPGLPIRIVQTLTTPRTFAVHDNVATIRIGRLTATAARRKLPSGEVLSGLVIAGVSVNVTWTGANGATLRHTTTAFRNLYINVHHLNHVPR